MTTLSVTTEFRHEFEAERTAWLRKRFLWYSGIVGGLMLVKLAVMMMSAQWTPSGAAMKSAAMIALSVASVGVFVGPFVFVKRGTRFNRASLLRFVTAMIMAAGLLSLVEIPVAAKVERTADAAGQQESSTEVPTVGLPEEPSKLRVSIGTVGPIGESTPVVPPVILVWIWAARLLLMHVIASLFIPWTPRESYRPLWPLIVCGTLLIIGYAFVVGQGSPLVSALTACALPLVGLPGAGIAMWRHGRFRSRFSYRMLRGAYGDMKRELLDARRIHEDLFPDPIVTGPVRMSYRYEPMRQIGGDYLFARMVQEPGRPAMVFDAVLIDVTGHGISAALTVNRLHGEIQRQLGERPGLSPGALLKGLNAYLHHTLAEHSVYATAICVRIDPTTNTIEWASAGHPPAFLCTADGRLDRLDSTGFILGVTAAEDYEAGQQSTRFMPGDSLVVYTDGAIEARDSGGRHLRVDGLQRILAGSPSGADRVGAVLEAVDRHRTGPVEDDTLIVEIRRPV